VWRVSETAPRTTWYLAEFDDRRWRRVRGAFGRRPAPGMIVRHTWETPDLYARTEFTVDRVPRRLTLELFHDRDVDVTINGHTVLRREGYTTDFVTIALPLEPAEILVRGSNVLAVHCRQERQSHALDVGLSAEF
jgi:hypothetical protein